MRRLLLTAAIVAIASLGACELLDGSPQIKISGPRSVGGAAEVLIGGETIEFGSVPNGESVDLTYTIQNIGTSTLQLFDTGGGYVEIINNTDGRFSVLTPPTTNDLDPDDAVTFVLRFTSNGSGAVSTAKVRIRSDDPDDQTLEFNLTGESLGPV